MNRIVRTLTGSFSLNEAILMAIFICGLIVGMLIDRAPIERARHELTAFKLATEKRHREELQKALAARDQATRSLSLAEGKITALENAHARRTATFDQETAALRRRLASRGVRLCADPLPRPEPQGHAPAAGGGHAAPPGALPADTGNHLADLAADADRLAQKHELLQNYTRELLNYCEGAK